MLFFVKVRIDVKQLQAFGQRLKNGELDTSHVISTYCLENDPSVGLNICEAKNRADLLEKITPHQAYYADIMEIQPVITPEAAMVALTNP